MDDYLFDGVNRTGFSKGKSMSLFGVAAVPLAKTFASLVMATSVGVAGISDAVVLKTSDADQVKKYSSVEVFEDQTPRLLKKKIVEKPFKDALGHVDHNHDDHVNMVIPGCPHCMANLLAPHPDWMPNLVRSGENESEKIRPIKDLEGTIVDLKFKDHALRLPPVLSEQVLRLPKQKPLASISKVPYVSKVRNVDSVSLKEKLGRVEHLNRFSVRSRT